MPHSFGIRGRTRHLFAKKFKTNGQLALGRILVPYKVGEYVDIKGDGAVHKGMPHKFYHGKTGVVWNVTKRAIGVELNKQVGNRIMKKRIHVRIEHASHSKCKDDFLNRVKENDNKKREASKSGKRVQVKRLPIQPRTGGFVKNARVETMTAVPYGGILA